MDAQAISALIPVVAVLVPVVAIIGGISVAIASIVGRTRLRELQIRERIAMIEKGLVPPPEVDPAGFDRAMDRYDRRQSHGSFGRHRRAGIILIGVGVGLAVLIGFADSFNSINEAIGVGGFVAIVGLAFLVSSFLDHSRGPNPSSSPASTSIPDRPKLD
jgi:hypothetical protein